MGDPIPIPPYYANGPEVRMREQQRQEDGYWFKTIAMCRDAETARGIAMALNAANAAPETFQVGITMAQAFAGAEATAEAVQRAGQGMRYVSGEGRNFVMEPPPEPMPPAECVDAAARQYLSDLFSFLSQLADDGYNPEDVPTPPWQDE
jgi:hypothetical protein